jgi:hypothetical protein
MASVEEMVAAVHAINAMVEETQGIIRAAQTKVEEAQGLALRTLGGSNNISAQEVQAYLDSMTEDLNGLQRKAEAIKESGNGYIGSL